MKAHAILKAWGENTAPTYLCLNFTLCEGNLHVRNATASSSTALPLHNKQTTGTWLVKVNAPQKRKGKQNL